MPSPEALARQHIDALLAAAGWLVQDRTDMNLAAGKTIPAFKKVRVCWFYSEIAWAIPFMLYGGYRRVFSLLLCW